MPGYKKIIVLLTDALEIFDGYADTENNVYIDVGDMTSLTYVSQADLGLMTLLEAYTLR